METETSKMKTHHNLILNIIVYFMSPLYQCYPLVYTLLKSSDFSQGMFIDTVGLNQCLVAQVVIITNYNILNMVYIASV